MSRIFWFQHFSMFNKWPRIELVIILIKMKVLPVKRRELWLDFEVMLCVYETQFAESLLALQLKYIEDSQEANPMPGAAGRQQSASARTWPGCAVRCFNYGPG